jgi:hypothetical protein
MNVVEMAPRVDTATPRYTIALARPQHLDAFPFIELAALSSSASRATVHTMSTQVPDEDTRTCHEKSHATFV